MEAGQPNCLAVEYSVTLCLNIQLNLDGPAWFAYCLISLNALATLLTLTTLWMPVEPWAKVMLRNSWLTNSGALILTGNGAGPQRNGDLTVNPNSHSEW